MNREIKFRGYNRKNNQWLYGFYLQNRGAHFVCPDDFATDKSWEDYEIDPDTLGQYTGYQDSMNVRIFEGDIVNVHLHEYDMVGRFSTKTDLKPYYRALVSYNERTCKYELLFEQNEQFNGTSHIVSCEIGWGHEQFLVVGKYIDDPFPLEKDRPQR